MRQIIISIFLFTLIPVNAHALNYQSFTGTIVTTSDQSVSGMLSIDNKNTGMPETFQIPLTNQGGTKQTYTINMSDVKKIIFLSSTDCRDNRYKFVIETKNSKSLKPTGCLSSPFNYKDYLYVPARHPVTGNLEYAQFGLHKIKEIIFNDTHGEVRVDEFGNTFPLDYEYSPYTGKPMKLKKVE